MRVVIGRRPSTRVRSRRASERAGGRKGVALTALDLSPWFMDGDATSAASSQQEEISVRLDCPSHSTCAASAPTPATLFQSRSSAVINFVLRRGARPRSCRRAHRCGGTSPHRLRWPRGTGRLPDTRRTLCETSRSQTRREADGGANRLPNSFACCCGTCCSARSPMVTAEVSGLRGECQSASRYKSVNFFLSDRRWVRKIKRPVTQMEITESNHFHDP